MQGHFYVIQLTGPLYADTTIPILKTKIEHMRGSFGNVGSERSRPFSLQKNDLIEKFFFAFLAILNESFCVIKLLFKPTETSTTRNHHERGGLNGKLLKTSYFASADTIFNCEQSPIRQRLDFSKPPGSSSPGNIFGRLRFQRPRGPQPFQRPQRPQRLQRLQRLQCLQRTEHSQGKSFNLNQGKLTLLLHGALLKSHKFLSDLKLPELLVPNPTNPLRPLLVARVDRKLSECLTPNPADPLRPRQDLKLTELTKSPVVEAYRKLFVFVLKSMKLVGSKTLQNCSSARSVEDSFVVRVVFSHYINVYLIFWTFIAAMESVRLG